MITRYISAEICRMINFIFKEFWSSIQFKPDPHLFAAASTVTYCIVLHSHSASFRTLLQRTTISDGKRQGKRKGGDLVGHLAERIKTGLGAELAVALYKEKIIKKKKAIGRFPQAIDVSQQTLLNDQLNKIGYKLSDL